MMANPSASPELPEWILSLTWECVGEVNVRGRDIDDAFERYLSEFQSELPPGEYVCDSLHHDREGSLIHNEHPEMHQPQETDWLVTIAEYNGEKEYLFPGRLRCSPDQDPSHLAEAIAATWGYLEEDEEPERDAVDPGVFWFEHGRIAVTIQSLNPIPPAHYSVLSIYLPDLTPAAAALARVTPLSPGITPGDS